MTISDASYSNSGLFGTVSGTVKNLNVSGTISGAKTAGGIVSVINGGTLDRCSFSGSVAGENDVGGLVGYVMNGTVRNAYSTAKVTNTNTSTSAENGCGGLVGDLYGSGASASIISSYATGEVMKISTADGSGGLVGYTHTYWGGTVRVIASFYDATTTKMGDETRGFGLKSASLKQQSTFTGWDFANTWGIDASVNSGYPYLKLTGAYQTFSLEGAGTERSPYLVTTEAELAAIARGEITNAFTSYYRLENDIAITGTNWTPIDGNGMDAFSGVFDGDGHTISGVKIDFPAYDNEGLFGEVSGTVKNLNVSGTISNAKTAGGVAGFVNGGTLDCCSFSGSVAGENDVGGLVGYDMNGTVRNAYSTAKVTNTNTSTSAENGCGGLVGDLYGSGASASIISSYATGEVMKTSTADGSGGLVGYTHTYWGGSTAITNCYFDNYNNSAADKGTYKTSSEMKQKSTYAGWDFDDIWSISASVNNGYPTLTHVPLTENTSVSGVSLNKSRLDLQIGNTGVLIATVRPLNASNKNVRWETSSGAVATISDGIVTAKGKGTATITVTTVDGGHQATCTVNVSESSGSNTGTGYKDVQVPVREQNDTSVEQRILDQMNPNDLLADMSFGNDTLRGPSITIHKKTFYLFEMEMNANIKITDKVSIQVKVDNKKKTFKVLLGYKLLKGSTAITGDPNSRDEKHDFWDSYTQAKSLYKLVSSKNTSPSVIRSKFKQQYDRLQTFQTDMLVKAEGSFSGYMELSYEKGKLDFSEGGAILGIKVNKTLSHRISAFPAAYATLKFELSAEDKIVVSKGESKPLLDMQFKAGFNTAVGLGLGKNTGIYQAYVEGGLEQCH